MKISKSILLVALALGTTGLLQAQDVTAKTPAKTESTKPSSEVKPVLAPNQKTTETKTDARSLQAGAAPATVSPSKDENTITPGNEKPTLKTIDRKEVMNPVSAENKKTADGTAGKPQHLAVAPASKNDQQAKPLTLAKPATVPATGQQQQ